MDGGKEGKAAILFKTDTAILIPIINILDNSTVPLAYQRFLHPQAIFL